jgi:CRP-like cAMP-binding protein
MSESILQRTGILAFMDDEAREHFAAYGEVIRTKPNKVLIEEGALGTQLYIILKGHFHVSTAMQGKEVRLDSMGPGDCLGEVSLFNPDRASATVITDAGSDGKLWTVNADALQQFLVDHPAAGCAAILGLNVILSRRLKRTLDVLRTHEIVPGFIAVRAKQRAETSRLGKFERRS